MHIQYQVIMTVAAYNHFKEHSFEITKKTIFAFLEVPTTGILLTSGDVSEFLKISVQEYTSEK